MPISLTDELRRIVAAVDALGPTGFRFAGRWFREAPDAPKEPEGAPPRVVGALQNAFYQHCYVRRFRGTAADPPPAPPRADDDLVPALSRANPGRERWEAGWTISQVLETGQVLAARHGVTRFLWPGEFVVRDAPGMQPRAGMQVSVFCPRESAAMQPGFYFAFGEAAPEADADADLLRFYFHVSDQGAPPLVHHAAAALNRYGVPFRLKALSIRSAYTRADAAVLYVGRRFHHVAAELLEVEVLPRIAPFLGADTPLFTLPLGPGVALAEDPETGESFGMARCRLLAEGVWQAREEGARTLDERMASVAGRFAAAGVSLERPHLNPGSPDRYGRAAPAAA